MEDQAVVDSSSWHSYPKVYAIGHANLAQLFFEPVTIEEKIDGSQFSFGVFDGVLRCRSKGKQLELEAPEKMFLKAVETVRELEAHLHSEWTYRAEYLSKPKHNVLTYDRVPAKHLIIFDINIGEEKYLDYVAKAGEADRLQLECVPLLRDGKIDTAEDLLALLDTDSILGGNKVEGIVCKNYVRFARDGKALLGKYVSEKFKERHNKDWKLRHPGGKDIVQTIGEAFKTEARWEKTIQHLRDEGRLDNSPKDIGALMKELHLDLEAEASEEIKEKLYQWSITKIKRIACAGFAEWYKDRLLKSQFEKEEDSESDKQDS